MNAWSSLVVLVGLFLALCVLYNVTTPPGEGPDEPGHVAYVFFLARERRLPVQCSPPCVGDVPGSGHHPPLAYLLATPAALWLPPALRTFDLPGNPRFTWAGGDQINAAAHGSREQWPWDAQVWSWRLARLVSSLAGAATIILTYLAAVALQRRPNNHGSEEMTGNRTALLAGAMVAFNPQFIFASSLVTNDALLAALGAALLWLLISSPRSLPRAALIGAILGMALITKQSALLFVPLAFVWCATGSMPRPRSALLPVPAALLVVIGVAGLIGGWWYVRNWSLYGDPLGLQTFRAEFTTQAFQVTSPAAWLGALTTLYESFWARFGWMNLPAPVWTMQVYTLVIVAAVAGWIRSSIRPDQAMCAWNWQIVALPLLAFVWVVSFALTTGLVAWQGRMLFPAMAAIAILIACGVNVWIRSRILTVAFIVGMAGLAAWMPIGVIQPAYPLQTLSAEAARSWEGIDTYARFARSTEPGAVIRRWRIDGTFRPAATIEVALLWHARSRQDRDWWTFVHLVDTNQRTVAEDNREPRDGAYPMSQWVAGDWVEARYTLTIPADLPPGSYALKVGLWDPATGRRAAFFDDDDVYDPDGDHVVLTTLVMTGQ
ncbi:MAG: hypothetical protein ACUVSY_06675 [Roseiflexus sp.]